MNNLAGERQNQQAEIQNSKARLQFALITPFVLQIVVAIGLTSFFSCWNGQQTISSHLAVLAMTIALGFIASQWIVKPALHYSTENISADELEKQDRNLHESLENFTKVFRASPDPIMISTLMEGRYIDVNDSFLNLFGYVREEVINSTSTELGFWATSEDHDAVRTHLQAEGAIRNLESDYCTKSGKIGTLLLTAEIIKINEQACILWTSKDITERKQAEADLKDSEAKLNNILSSAGAVIARFRLSAHREWTYEYFSPGTEAIFGYTPEMLQANKDLWISRLHPEDVNTVIPKLFEDILAERRTKVEFRFQHQDGTWRWISDTLVPHWDQSTNCWVVTCVEIDITDRKLAEAALRQREQEFRALAENAPDLIARLDRDLRYRYINPKLEQELGISATAFIGRTTQDLGFSSAVFIPFDTLLQQVFETGQEQTHEYIFPSAQRLTNWYARIVPEFADNGSVESILVVSRNITELKQAQEAFRLQAQREQALNRVIQAIRNSLDLNTIFSTAVSEVGQLLQVVRVAIVQYLPEQKVWLHVADYPQNLKLLGGLELTIPDEGNLIAAQLKQLKIVQLEDASDCQDPVNQALSKMFPGGWLLVPLAVGSSLWGSLTLARSRCPAQWQESEVTLVKAVADQLALAIQQSELYQQVLSLNTNLERQVQKRTAEVQVAFNFEATLKRITDKVRDSLDEKQILQAAVQELALAIGVNCCNAALYDLEQRTSTVYYESTPSSLSQNLVVWMTDFSEIYKQLLQGWSFQFCAVVPIPVQSHVAVLACPIFDDQGVLGDLWLIHNKQYPFQEQDIRLVQQVANQCAIALRQARLYQAAQAQVEELEKLNQLKDDFLNTVSHELRTPMSNIKMATQMLEIVLQQAGVLDVEPYRAARYFQILQQECQREISLINDLLDLARLNAEIEPLILTTINPKDWIFSTSEPFVERALNQQQQLQFDFADDLPLLITDLSCCGRILSELLNNACKYTEPGGTITVAVRATTAVLNVSVSNSGTELTADELDRIFDKFYRLPNNDPWKHGGTGLGLALVKKLVERLGATIQVKSMTGQITFTLQLPVAQ